VKDSFLHIINCIPFIGLAVRAPENIPRPLVTRLVEAAIIGGIVLYGSVQINSSRIEDMKSYMDKTVQQIREDQRKAMQQTRQDQRETRALIIDLLRDMRSDNSRRNNK